MISLIIPLYNVEAYVEESLKSALAQTYDYIEYILVDDCGTDSTMDIVRRVVDSSPCKNRVRIIRHTHNRGLSAARNTGMENAKGEYIFFMDSDDLITPDCIDLHIRAIKKTEADFSVGNISLQGSKSLHIKTASRDIETYPPFKSLMQRDWVASACNKLFRAEFLRKNNLTFEEGLLHEDIIWAFNVALTAKKIAVVEDATYIYRIHSNSITSGGNGDKKIRSLILILEEMRDACQKGLIPENLLPDFVSYYDTIRLNAALMLFSYSGTESTPAVLYKKIRLLAIDGISSKVGKILKLPFSMFLLLKPVYQLYKRYQTHLQKH